MHNSPHYALVATLLITASSLAGCARVGSKEAATMTNDTQAGQSPITLDVRSLEATPKSLCLMVDSSTSPGETIRHEATLQLERGRLHLRQLSITSASPPSATQEPSDVTVRNDFFHIDHLPQDPIRLTCGRSLRLQGGPPSASTAQPRASGSPPHIEAQSFAGPERTDPPSQTWLLGAQETTLADSHEDWEGGSGGELTSAWVDADTLRVRDYHVGMNTRREELWVFPLVGFVREQIDVSIASYTFVLVP